MGKVLSVFFCLMIGWLGANDEAAIRKSVESYMEAYEKGDAKGVAKHWSEDARYVHPLTGEEIVGRKAIEEEFKALFANGGKFKLAIEIESIAFPESNKAIEIGRAKVTRLGEESEESAYTAIYVKQNGKWLLQSVEEIDQVAAPTHFDQLKELAWMIGEWVDKDGALSLNTTCTWDKYQNFITHRLTASYEGREEFEARLIIGWDPHLEKIRSWMFDSDGGFGEGFWAQEGDEWIVQLGSTLSDGKRASQVNIYRPVDENTFTWQSVSREIDGEILPNIAETTIVRRGG